MHSPRQLVAGIINGLQVKNGKMPEVLEIDPELFAAFQEENNQVYDMIAARTGIREEPGEELDFKTRRYVQFGATKVKPLSPPSS